VSYETQSASAIFAPPFTASGSDGSAAIYSVTSASQSPGRLLSIFVAVMPAVNPAGRAPALSAAYCWIALRRAWTSELLLVLFAWANWRAGLMAISTMARRIARIPMTTRSSMRVKPFDKLRVLPFCDFNDLAVIIFLKLFFT